MLRITIPSTGQSQLDFSKLQKYDLPAPPGGFEPEINNDVIMLFEDEQQAIDYSHDIDVYAEDTFEHASPEYLVISDMIRAISDDAFIQAFING